MKSAPELLRKVQQYSYRYVTFSKMKPLNWRHICPICENLMMKFSQWIAVAVLLRCRGQ